MISCNVTHAHLHHLHHLLHPRMQTINILRTTLETEQFGLFLVDAFHDEKQIVLLAVYPIVDGIVGEWLKEYNEESLPDLVQRLQLVLQEME